MSSVILFFLDFEMVILRGNGVIWECYCDAGKKQRIKHFSQTIKHRLPPETAGCRYLMHRRKRWFDCRGLSKLTRDFFEGFSVHDPPVFLGNIFCFIMILIRLFVVLFSVQLSVPRRSFRRACRTASSVSRELTGILLQVGLFMSHEPHLACAFAPWVIVGELLIGALYCLGSLLSKLIRRDVGGRAL